MPFIPLRIPPGISRPGTKYDARGRWYDANLVRWYEGNLQPVGGWDPLVLTDETPVQGDGPVRGMIAWRDLEGFPVLVFGTYKGIWAFREDLIVDITPAGFVEGFKDADLVSGQYGSGAYGAGFYGEGVAGSGVLTEATSWQLDTFGQVLVAVAHGDGRLLWWTDPTSTTSPLVEIPNAPSDNVGVVVTPERFVVAIGAGGDGRLVAWSDQEDPTTWTPDVANQAGDFPLTTPGTLMAGRRSRQETLLWTDVDLWAMRFIGGTLVYSFQQLGSACGVVSRHAMAVVDGRAFWMGERQFFRYDGTVRPIPCDVAEHVFGSINRMQASKITCFPRSQFSEVVWHYPSAGSLENDRYVTYNYRDDYWSIGELERTSGVDDTAFRFPIAADAQGRIYRHEVPNGSYEAPDGNPLIPYAESGPIEVGVGDRVMMVRGIVPDVNTLGGVQGELFASTFPVQSEVSQGPFPLANPTSVRLTGRQVRLRVEGSDDWRVGTMRLDVVGGGRR